MGEVGGLPCFTRVFFKETQFYGQSESLLQAAAGETGAQVETPAPLPPPALEVEPGEVDGLIEVLVAPRPLDDILGGLEYAQDTGAPETGPDLSPEIEPVVG